MFFIDLVLALVMFGFNCWNWYLAFTGYTTVEFWTIQSECDNENLLEMDYSFQTIKDNLFRVFGTHKLMRILSPSLRNVPFTGIEWSFLQTDLGFDNHGFKLKQDIEMSRVNKRIKSNQTNQTQHHENNNAASLEDQFADVPQPGTKEHGEWQKMMESNFQVEAEDESEVQLASSHFV